MGIAMKELLALEYFKDFHVIAGQKGLNKEIQGVTVVDAPDGYCWTCGKELVLSSGYVIAQNPECLCQAFQEGTIQQSSGLMIKRERYLKTIPEDIIELCEQYEVPLITMPFSVPYMEVMNQINVAVLNRTIRRFRIHGNSFFQPSNLTYKEQKIKRILQAVEVEMKFPAFLYDLEEEKGYYSSANFKKITKSFGLEESEYWSTERPYTKHTLCDYIKMARYRLINQDHMEGPRVSWILIPISMNEIVQAYFVVMESREFIDNYDEYSIRIAFLMLQAVYEQIMVARSVGNVGFENFVHFALNYNDEDSAKLLYHANIQGIAMSTPYIYIMFRQQNPEISVRSKRKIFLDAFQNSKLSRNGKIAFLEENEGVLFLEANEWLSRRENIEQLLGEFCEHVKERFDDVILEFGICREEKTLSELKSCIQKCREVLKMGKIIFPKEYIWDYEQLGPLTWLQIPEKELDEMLREYRELLKDPKNIELLRTLKVYLEHNMNYSVTAEILYVHINTIRKRMNKVKHLLDIDWENHISRLKVELLLQFLDL